MRKLAIVTGGGRGIGAAICTLLAQNGYDVCVNYAGNSDTAEATAERCRTHGVSARAFQADISDSGGVDALFAFCDEHFRSPDLLVNNAGIVGETARLVDLTDAGLQAAFATNVFGAFYCSRAAARRMSTAMGGAGGVIVNISSIAATLGSPGEYVHYAASKAAVDAMTIGLSKELGPEGVRVNSIQTGTTNTDIHQRSGNPERPANVARIAPLRRVAQPHEIAEAVLFLASEKSAYTTGAILRVGGGL